MGNLITWIIAIPIVAVAAYIIVTNIKKSATGGGCDGCSSCDSDKPGGCNH